MELFSLRCYLKLPTVLVPVTFLKPSLLFQSKWTSKAVARSRRSEKACQEQTPFFRCYSDIEKKVS
jgi:hypothetical protein